MQRQKKKKYAVNTDCLIRLPSSSYDDKRKKKKVLKKRLFSFLKKSNSINDEYTEWAWNNLHKSKDDFIYGDGGRFVVPYDARSWIQEIEAETLVITGGRDKLVPEETSNDVVKRLNEVKVKTFPDAGHSVPWTHEEDLLTELREFFNL